MFDIFVCKCTLILLIVKTGRITVDSQTVRLTVFICYYGYITALPSARVVSIRLAQTYIPNGAYTYPVKVPFIPNTTL